MTDLLAAYYADQRWHSTGGHYPAFPRELVPPADGTVLATTSEEIPTLFAVAEPNDYFSAKYEGAGAWWRERAKLVRLPFGIVQTQTAPGTGHGQRRLMYVTADRAAAEAFAAELSRPGPFARLTGSPYTYTIIDLLLDEGVA